MKIKAPGDGEKPLNGDSKDGVEGAGQADLGDWKQERNQHREDLHIFSQFGANFNVTQILRLGRSSLSASNSFYYSCQG